MSAQRKTVFISCGQYSEEERSLGKRVAELIRECTPFDGYFAENQTTLATLTENVLRQLYESVGIVVIMHHRGMVETPRGKLTRASVWVEQEVAIATLMQQILKRPLRSKPNKPERPTSVSFLSENGDLGNECKGCSESMDFLPTHSPTHNLRCLVRLPRSLAVPAVL
jgi:hypothetical protein